MPALSDIQLKSGFVCTQAVHGQQVQIMTGPDEGQWFTATLLVAPNVDFQGLVTEDVREKNIAHFPDDNYPNVRPQDTMKDSYGNVWKFIKRTNNPLDNTVDFEVMKVLPKDT